VLVYHTGTDRGGPPALADLATPGPYHVSLYELEPADLADAHESTALQVPPGMPAERLAGDPALADSTRRTAPESRLSDQSADESDGPSSNGADQSAVEAFLDDEAKVAAIQEQAREEARERAAAWDLDDIGK
jgi:hypothetical protein